MSITLNNKLNGISYSGKIFCIAFFLKGPISLWLGFKSYNYYITIIYRNDLERYMYEYGRNKYLDKYFMLQNIIKHNGEKIYGIKNIVLKGLLRRLVFFRITNVALGYYKENGIIKDYKMFLYKTICSDKLEYEIEQKEISVMGMHVKMEINLSLDAGQELGETFDFGFITNTLYKYLYKGKQI